MNYLRIGKDNHHQHQHHQSSAVSRAISSLTTDSDYGKFRKANLDILQDFGDNFLDTLSRDTVSGHDIRRMLALSVLDELVHLDGRGGWTYYMSNQGYLRHIIESMSVEDPELARLLTPDPENLRAIYVYESKMALLTRLASTVAGAELLLESGLMLRLSEMTIFSSRPDVSAPSSDPSMMMDFGEEEPFVPSPLARYHQILFPALRLCQALLAALGGANRSATAQVRHFVISNEEMVRAVLKSRQTWTLSHLQELSLLTGVISRAFSAEDDDDDNGGGGGPIQSAADMERSAHATRVQRLMLSLVPLCDLSEEAVRRVQAGMPERQ